MPSFLQKFDPTQVDAQRCYPSLGAMEERVRAVFGQIDPSGKAGAECWSDYQQKLARWHGQREALEDFLAHWQERREELARLTLPPRRVLELIEATSRPLDFGALQPPQTKNGYAMPSWPRR